MNKLLICVLVFTITACSSSTTAKKVKGYNGNEKTMVCEHSAKTGSHLKKKKCMSPQLAKEMQRRNQEALRSQEHKGQTSAGVGG